MWRFVIVFFKQKTAYEMRISDWSSDVCSCDLLIVASVSCLYGIGSVETYSAMTFSLAKGQTHDPREIIRKLVALQYKRNEAAFQRGAFRVRGDTIELFPSHYEDTAWRITFFGDEIGRAHV